MRVSLAMAVSAAALTFLSGCIVFPHGELVAPLAHGRVVAGDTRSAISRARVVWRIENVKREAITVTDPAGEFAFKKKNRLGWLLMVDYAAREIHYRIVADGYRSFETNLHGGGSFSAGRRPHELGLVLLEPETEKIEPDGASNRSQPVGPPTNRTSSAAGSGR
jgi:hypothetical protein